MDEESLSLGIFGVGVAIDHLSTSIGLMTGYLVELNPFTLHLISLRLWLLFDISILCALSWSLITIFRKWDLKEKRILLLLPIIVGVVRLGAGIHNIFLLFCMM